MTEYRWTDGSSEVLALHQPFDVESPRVVVLSHRNLAGDCGRFDARQRARFLEHAVLEREDRGILAVGFADERELRGQHAVGGETRDLQASSL